MERNAAYTGHAIDMNIRDADEDSIKPRTCGDRCRSFGVCIRVSPWVPLIGTLMIAAGLPIWAIYTRKALDASVFFSDTLIGVHTFAVEQMASNVSQVTGLGIIIVSAVVGLGLLLSLLRTFQETASLPSTKCGAPGKVSYGFYVTLISVITFALWLMSIVVALLIAAQLCWLLLAFMFQSALAHGVAANNSMVSPQAYQDAATAALSSLVDHADKLPVGNPITEPATSYVKVVKEGNAEVCPETCMNLGSFRVVFESAASCLCNTADQYPVLLSTITDIWKFLVHALAALAIMGLADLWLIMNLSAQFAHAKRDMRDLKHRYAVDGPRISDDAASVYVSTNPAYISPKKAGGSNGRRDVARDHDTRKSPIKTSGPTYRTALDALPDSVINPAPAAAEPGPIPPAEEVEELETAEGAAAASAQAVHEAEGAEASPARQQYNTTAQRYAAYRLRAAQANAVKSNTGERKWTR